MPLFSEEKLAEIRERLPINELISDFVELKKAGKNYKGLCPFHQEKSPSFIVSPERESFHCFGCGAGGNIFHFLMKMDSVNFPEAVERLAERAGVEIVKSSGKNDPQLSQKKQKAFELQRQAAWYYHCLLEKTPKTDPIWTYLAQRQIDEETVKSFHLGFCPNRDSGLLEHLKKKGFNLEDAQQDSLYRGKREFFRGRLIFPIFNHEKKAVALGGRIFEEKDRGPKYLNSPESLIFRKGELFYGMHKAKAALRKANRAIIVEGYMDVISMHRYGYEETIAPLGTALTAAQARSLKRMGVEVVLAFDGDKAGQSASLRALETLLEVGILPTALQLEPGEDPDSLLKRDGKLQFDKKLSERHNLLESLIENSLKSLSPASSEFEKKAEIARNLLRFIDKIPDSIIRNLYRRRLAELLQIPESWFGAQIGKNIPPKKVEIKSQKTAPWLAEEAMIFKIWLQCEELRGEMKQNITVTEFLSPKASEIAELLWGKLPSNPEHSYRAYPDTVSEEQAAWLSELALHPDLFDGISAAKKHLEEARFRLKERRLRNELQSLKNLEDPQAVEWIQEKIQDLSKVLKNKERGYGQRKSS